MTRTDRVRARRLHALVAGIAPLAIASLMTMQPAVAQEQRVGSWIIGPGTDELPVDCLMIHADRTSARLFLFVGEFGDQWAGYSHRDLELSLGRAPTLTLKLDQQVDPVSHARVLNRTTALMLGNNEGSSVVVVERLLKASTITVGIGDNSHTFITEGTRDAVGVMNGCLERAEMDKVAQVEDLSSDHEPSEDEASGRSDNPYDTARIAALLDQQTSVSPKKPTSAQASPNPRASASPLPSPSTPSTPAPPTATLPSVSAEADQLRQALSSLGNRAPMIAKFECLMTGSEMMGILDINGNDSFDNVTLLLAEDGSLLLNGTTLPSVYMVVATDGSGMPARAVFDARKVIGAIQSKTSGRAPLVNMTPDEQRAWDFVMGTYVPGVTDLVMGDKARYMMVDLDANTVGFFDLEAGNQPANQATSSCLRTG